MLRPGLLDPVAAETSLRLVGCSPSFRADGERAVAHAAEMERELAAAGVSLEQVHHGDGIASWAVNRRAVERGHGIRTGLEDTPVLPNGRLASGNGELVAAAAVLLAGRVREGGGGSR